MPPTAEHARLTQLRDALQLAEEHFFATFELAPVGIAHFAPDGRWLRVNRRASAIVGYEAGDLLARRFQDHTHPEDLAADLDQALRTLAGEQTGYTIRKRFIRGDGASLWTECRVALVRDLATEKPLYFVAIIDDITPRRRAEQAMERRAAELQTLLDGLPDIVARFDRAGRHLYVNPAVERATGRPAAEFLGRTNRELGMPLPLVEEWERVLAAVVETGEPGEVRFTFPTPDGERRYWSLLIPENGPAGEIAGVLCVSREIPEGAPAQPGQPHGPAGAEAHDPLLAGFEETGAGIAEVGPDGRLLRANRRFHEIVGHAPGGLDGRTFQEIALPADLRPDLEQVGRALAGEIERCAVERRYLRPGGTAAWAELVVSLVRDPRTGPAYLVVMIRDVQPRPPEERAPHRAFADAIPPLAWSAGPEGLHDYHNARWCAYTGLSAGDSAGFGWLAAVHSDDRAAAEQRWRRSLRDGEPYASELRLRGRDGEHRWFLAQAAPLRDAAGSVARWFGTCTDIQAQKDVEAGLRDARERLETALDASSTGTFRWDLRTGAFHCDAGLAAVLGLPPEQAPVSLAGLARRLHPDDRDRVAAAVRGVAVRAGGFELEFRVIAGDGGTRWVLGQGRATLDGAGRPVSVSGACVDVTRRRRAEEDLALAHAARGDAEAANALKSRFVANMSHEIRTPINAMLGYADLLDAGVSGALNEAQWEQVRRIVRSGRHLLALVNDNLDMAKIEAGEIRVVPARIDLRPLCLGVLELMEPLFRAHAVQAVDEADGLEGLEAWGDADRVRQILVNLLTNACKFTPPGRSVTLRASDGPHPPGPGLPGGGRGRWLGVDVVDTGPGIAPEMHDRIFSPFVQDEAGRRARDGTGLGLAISRTLARLMGGDVTLRSAPGEGACFTLWLPAAPADP